MEISGAAGRRLKRVFTAIEAGRVGLSRRLGPCNPAAAAEHLHLFRSTFMATQHSVSFRWACNKRLRVAITTFAANSRFSSPWATDSYDRARASGKDHPHATRILARAWVRVMWRCWQNGTTYDQALHGGAQHLVDQQVSA
jgi:hypothetical protein